MEGDFGVETETDVLSTERCIGVGIDDVGSGVKFKVGLMEGEALIEGEGDLAGVLDGAGDMDGDGLEEICIEDSLGNSLGGLTRDVNGAGRGGFLHSHPHPRLTFPSPSPSPSPRRV